MNTKKTKIFAVVSGGILVILLVLGATTYIMTQKSELAAEQHRDDGAVTEETSAEARLDTSGARPSGMALYDRAADMARTGEHAEALAALEGCVAEWETKPWTVPNGERRRAMLLGRQLALLALEEGETEQAVGFVSAGARASGRPYATLQEFRASLSSEVRETLWPESPFIRLRDFGGEASEPPVFFGAAEDVAFEASVTVPEGGANPCGQIVVISGRGRPCFGIPTQVDLSSGVLGFRMKVRAQTPMPVSLAVRLWFPRAKRAEMLISTDAQLVQGHWVTLSTERDFLKYSYDKSNSEGFDMSDGYIDRVGIAVAGDANTYWVDAPEMYVP